MKWLITLLLNSLALLAADFFVAGFHIRGFVAALTAALVLGLANTFIRPVLLILTLPITFFTLGLFILVVNGLVFMMVAWFVPGFTVYSFWGALWGALITSIVSWFLNGILNRGD